ncbi:MAG: hypothetical protein EAZ42_08210 [Verrucomicrobia bacterium]|nr:MAG: hypothetical protein EAZ42_08210 [Verrucomicrobiota bacterium]
MLQVEFQTDFPLLLQTIVLLLTSMKTSSKFIVLTINLIFPVCLQAAVTFTAGDVFSASTGSNPGNLAIVGDLSVYKGLDVGTTTIASSSYPAISIDWYNASALLKTASFDISDGNSSYQWRDNLAVSGGARVKMKLDQDNLLSLYNSSGTSANITLNGQLGQIQLSGAGSGIYSDGTPVFSLDAAGKVNFGTTRQFAITNTTPSTSDTTGALTVSGGLGVRGEIYAFRDAYINRVRIGKGAGFISAVNTVVGRDALAVNTSGNYNSAFGYLSLSTNVTGHSNTAIGQSSLSSNTEGAWNASVGLNASKLNTTGNFNTAIGSGALISNATGGSNIAIGNMSGAFVADGITPLTDPENSIYIGTRARGFSNDDNNSIVIGSSAIGEGPNTTVLGNKDTLKAHLFGQTILSNMAWKNDPNVIPSAANSNCQALVVEGHADLKGDLKISKGLVVTGNTNIQGETTLNGKVVIATPQGDISMGIFSN